MNFNRQIIKLWEDYIDELARWYGESAILAPMLYPELSKNSLLTIGINPSFSEVGIKKLLKKHSKEELEKIMDSNPEPVFWKYYSFTSRKNNLPSWINYEKLARAKYSYYNRFKEITNLVGMNWSHIDLYFLRATKQDKFLEKIKDYTQFDCAQLKLTKQIVEDLKPKLILVANAHAASRFKSLYKNKIHWDDEKGCYFTKIGDNLTTTHISGQLTYMDNESYKRLKWVIKNALG
ncbi:MAG: hypothetical protein NWE89_03825 [Candidatus Bathyarchaeota archaeon]|nr:hypothetical protein [Candidatus Bathyarchaeota archaeon]